MTLRRREFLAFPAAAMAKLPETDDIFFASIAELHAGLRKRQFSSVELTRAFTSRLERLGPRYSALALLRRTEAIREAKEADDELKRERFRGPLQGIPYAAKDLFAVEGEVTTWGAQPFVAQVFDYSAAVIQKLGKVRAPLIGKLTMVELAGGPSYSKPGASLTGACLNPWDRSAWAGGSSSGSGAAVAAGLVPFALGTETSGSIITPAAFCGITGLRPTFGMVSRYGAMALSPSLDKVGPMCRTAEDCGLVLAVLAGGDSRDPGSAGKNFYYAPQFARPFKQLRVGWSPAEFDAAAEPVRPALRQALEVVRSFGAEMIEKPLPDAPDDAVFTLIAAEAGHQFRELIESGRVDQLGDRQQIDGLRNGLKVTAADYLKAKDGQAAIIRAFEQLFYDVDVYVAPSRLATAPKANQPFGQNRGSGSGRTESIPSSNLAGIPALSVPCGFSEGLPVGIQFLGPRWTENRLLSFGVEFQRQTDWHKRRPSL